MHNQQNISNNLKLTDLESEILEQSKKLILQRLVKSSHEKITVADFINQAQYQAEYGYYQNQLKKIGTEGDFVTAPHISPLFAKTIFNYIKKNRFINIIEIGVGEGKLTTQLNQLIAEDKHQIENYVLFDIGNYADSIATTIKNDVKHSIKVCKDLASLKEYCKNSIIISNEVLDAMPVQLLRFDKNFNFELATVIAENRDKKNKPADHKTIQLDLHYINLNDAHQQNLISASELKQIKQETNNLKEYFTENQHGFSIVTADNKSENNQYFYFEVNNQSCAFLSSLVEICEKCKLLFFDYGHQYNDYNFLSKNGSLRSYFQHRLMPNFLLLPGISDITHSVNFTQVLNLTEELFEQNTLQEIEFSTQAEFLIENKIEQIYQEELNFLEQNSSQSSNLKMIKLGQEVQQLIIEMGSIFKVLNITTN